jgi:hypothetical protein
VHTLLLFDFGLIVMITVRQAPRWVEQHDVLFRSSCHPHVSRSKYSFYSVLTLFQCLSDIT